MTKVMDTPVTALQEIAVERLNWAGQFFDAVLDSLGDDQMLARAGGKGNHPLWVMGHIAQANDTILAGLCRAKPRLPERYEKLFAGGTEAKDDRSLYPSRAEVRKALHDTRRRVIEWVQSLDETTARAPAPEALLPLAPDNITMAFAMTAHDLFHLGQVASVRASLGLAPVLG